jgi:hypothetical protein
VNNTGAAGVTVEYAENLIGVFVVSFTVPNQTGDSVPVSVTVTPVGEAPITSAVSHIPISQ